MAVPLHWRPSASLSTVLKSSRAFELVLIDILEVVRRVIITISRRSVHDMKNTIDNIVDIGP